VSVTSVGLSGLPFISSCDSTRIQMANKQINQALTTLDCEIPFVVSNDYRNLTNSSELGICVAKEDGKVFFNENDIIIYYLKDSQKLIDKYIPRIKKTAGIYSSALRFSLSEGQEFNKGDIIYEYDCFRSGIPSFGYNIFTAYTTFFGFNHEDSAVVSESFAKKAKVNFLKKLFIPVFDYTIFYPIYKNIKDSNIYFPSIGQKLQNKIFAARVQPKQNNIIYNASDMKTKTLALFKNMNLSEFLNIQNIDSVNISSDSVIKVDFSSSVVSNLKVHKLKKDNFQMIDKNLQEILNHLNKSYIEDTIIPCYEKLKDTFIDEYSVKLIPKYMLYIDLLGLNNRIYNSCLYLLEVDITDIEETIVGDKISNRYANKGIISIIIPDELRPIAKYSNTPIDLIFSPFSVFSRMNVAQIIEGLVSKNIWMADKYIKSYPNEMHDSISWINENIIKYFNNNIYYNNVSNFLNNIKNDKLLYNKVYNNIKENNLFIEAPDFSAINIREIYKNSIPLKENVILSKDLLQFIKEKLHVNKFDVNNNIELNNIMCSPIYIMKLYKLVNHLYNSRDIGQLSQLTKNPTRGRANGGGSRLGQMELEAIIAHGAQNVLKEFMTVKSDYSEMKSDLIDQLVKTGEYKLNLDYKKHIGGSKKVVKKFIEFLKD
jgi:DNA-directed RNA polymerase subunit beta